MAFDTATVVTPEFLSPDKTTLCEDRIFDESAANTEAFIQKVAAIPGVKAIALTVTSQEGYIAAVKQVTNWAKINNSPVIGTITKMNGTVVEGTVKIAINGAVGGWNAAVKSTVGVGVGWLTQSTLLTLGTSTAIASGVGAVAGLVAGVTYSEWQSWEVYKANLAEYQDKITEANFKGQLKIVSSTDNMEEIQNFLNNSGFLAKLNTDTKIAVVVNTAEPKVYEVIRGNKYNDIISALSNRNFDLEDLYSANTNTNLEEKSNNGKYRLFSEEYPYFLLEDRDEIYFPVRGNAKDNTIYVPESSVLKKVSNVGQYLDENGKQHYFSSGGLGNDTILGSSDADEIFGEDFAFSGNGYSNTNDSLVGGAGNDTIWGQYGNDTLKGGADNDLLEGGKGNDKLYGGEDYDTYVFEKGDGQDVIIDSDKQGKVKINTNTLNKAYKVEDKTLSLTYWQDSYGNDLVTAA